ncbi:hypothetical protein H6B10_17650, partial [Gemmiger formicilis]|nr:hypothetical protein [Gemmiger formicilis]
AVLNRRVPSSHRPNNPQKKKQNTRKKYWVRHPAMVAAAVFLLNIGTQGMAVFTRMYALLMLETVVLVALHLR